MIIIILVIRVVVKDPIEFTVWKATSTSNATNLGLQQQQSLTITPEIGEATEQPGSPRAPTPTWPSSTCPQAVCAPALCSPWTPGSPGGPPPPGVAPSPSPGTPPPAPPPPPSWGGRGTRRCPWPSCCWELQPTRCLICVSSAGGRTGYFYLLFSFFFCKQSI